MLKHLLRTGFVAASLAACGGLFPLPALALSPTEVESLVTGYLDRQLSGSPGQRSYRIGPIANQSLLSGCQAAEVETLPNSRMVGRIMVRLRCTAGANWTMLIQVGIRIHSDFVVLSRAVTAGTPLQAADLATQRGDLGELPAGVLTDPGQAIGRVTRVNLPAGRPLRVDLLKEVIAVRNGQTVRVLSRGSGFEVSSQGTALNQAAPGEPVRVKLSNGQVVGGRALAEGIVEVIN